jgi:hypothetical protein
MRARYRVSKMVEGRYESEAQTRFWLRKMSLENN